MADSSKTQVSMVSGVAGAANLDARIAGFDAKIATDYPSLEIVDTVYCDDDAKKGCTVA